MARSCLVIMPFSVRDDQKPTYPQDHWKEVYAGLLGPAVKAAGLACHRDDDDFSSRPISLNIWRKIESADIILCDVSSCNPNVFMELGWAIRADKPYVIVMDELTKAPFDVADVNRFHYNHALRPLALQEEIARLARMLQDTLHDPSGRWSIVRNLGVPSPKTLKRIRPRCTVDIYYHEDHFTRTDADTVAEALNREGIEFRLMEHAGPGCPDALFIGSLVEFADARLVASLIPYEVKFLFRPDYPESEGGDSKGYKLGVGYTSRYNLELRGPRGEPVPVTREQMKSLFGKRHTNTSFQHLLRDLTLRGPKDSQLSENQNPKG